VRDVGRGLTPVAWAGDGIVEALESEDGAWLLGVQWELQESWRDDSRFLEVFAAFAEAARHTRSSRLRRSYAARCAARISDSISFGGAGRAK
jgi:putative glutamine amidotransferase